MMDSHPLLKVDDLTVEFRTRNGVVRAVEKLDITLRRGETLGIVGESGSGKSVTSFAVMRLLDRAGRIADGRILLGGVDVRAASEGTVRSLRGREVSMIFQNPRAALNPIRPIGRQIADVLREHGLATRSDAKQKAIEALRQVRIARPEERYHAYPFELSGGMCQRVVIALALACRPALLIADEPTTGLDVTTQKAVMDLVVELARERRMATILIPHDLGLAAAYCDRICVMQKGRLVEQASTAALFGAPAHPYSRRLMRATPRRDSKVRDLLPEEAPAAPLPPTRPPGAPLLEVRDLMKVYPAHGSGGLGRMLRRSAEPAPGGFKAVAGISFTVAAGESVGLVGESGCGKSTTSSMVMRLLDPTSGQILFDGEDLALTPARRFAASPRRRELQMVFQDPTDSLNPRFTAFRSIADPLLRLGGMGGGAALRSRVEELAEQVGLPVHLLDRFPHQLSGGQKARVGIARAIALSPKLLILDEPTAALDVSVQAVVLNLLVDLKAQLGMSYLFVSHDLNVVRLLCDRVIVMRQGEIVETGRTADVLRAPSHPYTRDLLAAIPEPPEAAAA